MEEVIIHSLPGESDAEKKYKFNLEPKQLKRASELVNAVQIRNSPTIHIRSLRSSPVNSFITPLKKTTPTIRMKTLHIDSPSIHLQSPHKDLNNAVNEGVPVFYEYPDRKQGIAISPSRLIEQHLAEIRKRIDLHDKSSQYYDYWHKVMGFPIKLISGFLSSTMMYTIASHNNQYVNVINLIMSSSLFVLSTSKEHLKYEEKNKSHDISSKLYTNLLRSIEKRLSIKKAGDSDISPEEKNDMFKDLVEQMTIIEQFDLIIPSNIAKKN